MEAVYLGLLGANHIEEAVDLALLLSLKLLVQLPQARGALVVGAVWPGAGASGAS